MVEGVGAGGGVGGPAPLPRDSNATTADRFAVTDGAPPLASNGRPTSVAGIGLETMLTLQAVDEMEETNRAARKHGSRMLAALTRLQRSILAAEDPAVALRALTELTTGGPRPDDPELGAILRAVILRTRVELARHEHSG